MITKAISISDRVLLSAADLDAVASPFTREQLVVAAWEKYPQAFGMKGFDFPDANRVDTTLHGERGLVRRGYLYRVSSGHYSLSADGRRKVRQLKREQDERIAGQREKLLAARA